MTDPVSGNGRAWLAAMLATGLFAAGCSAPTAFAGIPLAAGAAQPELQALAWRAQGGDKSAQLELGILYEEGRGVIRDLKRAASLYARAARPSGGTIWIYSPPVGKASGRVIPVSTGPHVPGLPEAARRLAALKQRR